MRRRAHEKEKWVRGLNKTRSIVENSFMLDSVTVQQHREFYKSKALAKKAQKPTKNPNLGDQSLYLNDISNLISINATIDEEDRQAQNAKNQLSSIFYTIHSINTILSNGHLFIVVCVSHSSSPSPSTSQLIKKKILVGRLNPRGNPPNSQAKSIPFRRTVKFRDIQHMAFDCKTPIVLTNPRDKMIGISFLHKGRDKMIRIGTIGMDLELRPLNIDYVSMFEDDVCESGRIGLVEDGSRRGRRGKKSFYYFSDYNTLAKVSFQKRLGGV